MYVIIGGQSCKKFEAGPSWKIYDLIDSKGEKKFEKFDKNQFEIRSVRLHL